jgi:hypothetical protein
VAQGVGPDFKPQYTKERKKIKKNTNNKCWYRCGEKRTFHMLLVGMYIRCKIYGKHYGGSSEKLKIELPYDSAIPLLEYIQRNVSQVTTKAPAHPCLLQHYSQ